MVRNAEITPITTLEPPPGGGSREKNAELFNGFILRKSHYGKKRDGDK